MLPANHTFLNDLLADEVPQEALGTRIHARGGLVHEHYRWTAHQRNRNAQLTLIASAV